MSWETSRGGWATTRKVIAKPHPEPEPDWGAGGGNDDSSAWKDDNMEWKNDDEGFKNDNDGNAGYEPYDNPPQEPEVEVCRNCRKQGHAQRNCPEPRVCFNCLEPGHSKPDCPNPRKPRGPCRVCSEEGHVANDCPNKPPVTCYNCGQDGHQKNDCINEKVFRGTCRHCGVDGHPSSQCPDKPKRNCYNCGEEGHNKTECPQPAVPFEGRCLFCKEAGHRTFDCPSKPEEGFPCLNCMQPGHESTDCPEPKSYRGVCRHCNEEGHPGSQCPKRICKNCNEEGHIAPNCTNPRQIHQPLPEDYNPSPEQIWEVLKQADREGDLEDFKTAMLEYARLIPSATFRDLEEAFRYDREYKFKVHLIAMDTTLIGNKTLVNLQGIQNQKYVVKLQLGDKPKRQIMVQRFQSADKEENLKRLEEAGFIMDSFKLFCNFCKEIGHVAKFCKEPRPDPVEKRDEYAIRGRTTRDGSGLAASTWAMKTAD